MSAILFDGGRIHIGDGTSGEALLARDGRVAAVGRRDEVRREAGRAEVVDLRGGVMVPGWFDAHVHFVWWAQQMSRLDIAGTRTHPHTGSIAHRSESKRETASLDANCEVSASLGGSPLGTRIAGGALPLPWAFRGHGMVPPR